MSELPASWARARLNEACNRIQYGFTASSSAQELGPQYLRITDIQDGRVEWRSVPRVEAKAGQDAYRLRKGDIVFARTGATVGKSFLITEEPDGAIFASYLIRVSVEQNALNPGFAAFFFQSPDYWEQILEGAAGTGQSNFNGSKLAQLSLPVPPLAEQRRIVAKLDALTARTARARADLDRIPALAARYKQAVLAKAFSGELTADWRAAQPALEPISPRSEIDIRPKYRLGGATPDFAPPYEVPETWRWLRLPELGDMDRGKSRHRPRDDARLFDGPFPFVQTGEVRAADRYLTSYSKTYSAFGLEQSKLWPIGTVCITIAANIAETAILGIEACFPDSVVGFNADAARCLPDYVEYFIRTAKADLEQFAPATAQKNINLEVLGSIRLPVASLHEQAEIVRRIDRAFAEIDRMVTEAAAARRLLDRLDQAVLAKAFRGELVPQDPADEPASVLLDRIRSERAAAPKAKRGRKGAAA